MSSTPKTRYLSVDAFRGLTIMMMILVNTPGSWAHIYAPLRHAHWHGLTPTDLVFPFFLFISGLSIWFSLGSKKISDDGVALKIIKRTLIIYGIGLFFNWFPFYTKNFADVRLLGVLHRIAICYGVVGFMVVGGIKLTKTILITLLGLALAYWAILFFGVSENPYSLESNIVRVIDLKVLGASHLYKGEGIPFDPEGLISTIGSICTMLIGVVTGQLFKRLSNPISLIKNLVILGLICLSIAYLWDIVLPINKKLWTSSYVFAAAGYALLLLSLFVYFVDFLKWKRLQNFFVVVGMNPLFCYCLSVLIVLIYFRIHLPFEGKDLNLYAYLYKGFFSKQFGPLHGSFAFALSHVVAIWIMAYPLYKKKIYIKI